jgi:hypothetical protein
MQAITHPPKPNNEYRALQRRNRNLFKNHQQFKPNLIQLKFNKSQENARRKEKQ